MSRFMAAISGLPDTSMVQFQIVCSDLLTRSQSLCWDGSCGSLGKVSSNNNRLHYFSNFMSVDLGILVANNSPSSRKKKNKRRTWAKERHVD